MRSSRQHNETPRRIGFSREFPRAVPVGFAGGLCVLISMVGCDFVVRNEPEVDVRRLAETWPPYQQPAVVDPITGDLVSKQGEASASMPATNSSTNSAATQIAESATMIKAPAMFKPIRRAEEWNLPETAMDSLGRIGAPAVPALVEALEHGDPMLRMQAATVLARIGPAAKQSVPSLVGLLTDEDEKVRKAAARALGQIGPAAEEAVFPLLEIIEGRPIGDARTGRQKMQPAIQPASATTPIE